VELGSFLFGMLTAYTTLILGVVVGIVLRDASVCVEEDEDAA